MFGLPLETSIVVFGFPAFWIFYTVVFVLRTKHWNDESVDEPGHGDDSG